MGKGLIGLFFHSYEEGGETRWQGRVDCSPDGGWYLVELYDWIGGDGGIFRLVRIEQMADWNFYESDTDMKAAYKNRGGR